MRDAGCCLPPHPPGCMDPGELLTQQQGAHFLPPSSEKVAFTTQAGGRGSLSGIGIEGQREERRGHVCAPLGLALGSASLCSLRIGAGGAPRRGSGDP